jgi:hypothetical protein
MLVLVGPGPIGTIPGPTEVPATFAVRIPANTICRKYSMTAIGVPTSGENLQSDPIEIDVERPDLPVRLSNQMPSPHFRSPDGSFPLMPAATFRDGTTIDVTDSSKVTYRSTNPGVAQIGGEGNITAKSPGVAQVIATYEQDGKSVQLAVPVTVEVGPVASSRYALQFGSVPVGTPSVDRPVMLTARTLGPLRILDIRATGDFSESDNCRDSSRKTGESCTVEIRFQPRQSGSREGQLEITNDFGEPLTIWLAGTGS